MFGGGCPVSAIDDHIGLFESRCDVALVHLDVLKATPPPAVDVFVQLAGVRGHGGFHGKVAAAVDIVAVGLGCEVEDVA